MIGVARTLQVLVAFVAAPVDRHYMINFGGRSIAAAEHGYLAERIPRANARTDPAAPFGRVVDFALRGVSRNSARSRNVVEGRPIRHRLRKQACGERARAALWMPGVHRKKE